MGQRIDLHNLLRGLLGSDKVYFQPPPDFRMEYPCILYNLERIHIGSADNRTYRTEKQYLLTVIDSNPDSLIPQKVAELPRCSYDRHFKTSNLIHDVFTIIF